MEEMTLEEKGLFTQTILRYQNWKELWNISPIKFIWSKVKKQLETDNKKRAEELEKRSKAWIEGNKKRRGDRKSSQVIASATSGSQLIPVNVNVNDNVTVNDNVNNIYTLYPSSCKFQNNRSTGKSSKDKKKIDIKKLKANPNLSLWNNMHLNQLQKQKK